MVNWGHVKMLLILIRWTRTINGKLCRKGLETERKKMSFTIKNEMNLEGYWGRREEN